MIGVRGSMYISIVTVTVVPFNVSFTMVPITSKETNNYNYQRQCLKREDKRQKFHIFSKCILMRPPFRAFVMILLTIVRIPMISERKSTEHQTTYKREINKSVTNTTRFFKGTLLGCRELVIAITVILQILL